MKKVIIALAVTGMMFFCGSVYAGLNESDCQKVTHTSPPSTTNETAPTFTWEEDTASTWYKFWIGSSNGDKVFAQWYDAAEICYGGNCTVSPALELAGTDFEWYIKSWNDHCKIWSDGMAFTVQNGGTPPSEITHTSPSSTTNETAPTFTWEEDTASTWYKFWIGTPSGDKVLVKWYDGSKVCSGGSCSVTLESELADGDYVWFIKSWNYYGNVWSDGELFTIDSDFVVLSGCNDITLLKTINISEKLSPEGESVGRPDVIAIRDTLYLTYGIRTERNFHLIKLNPNLSLSLIEDATELFSGYLDFSVDIRVSKANNKLWYAFEDNNYVGDVGDIHFLNGAWYSENNNLIGQQTDIANGILTTIPEAFFVNPEEVPSNPEAVDDPTPFWHNNSYYIFTRAWSGFIDEFTPNSKHHIRVFNESFEKTDDFMLDLSTIIPGKTLSQNTLTDIDGQVYLIGGFYNARDDIAGGASVYAIPLSNDLKTPVDEKIPLLVETGKWFFKSTAARIYDGNLFINFQELLSGETTQNIAIFNVNNNFELIKTIEISRITAGETIANHTTFEILNDMLFVFYPEVNNQIFAKIFSLWKL